MLQTVCKTWWQLCECCLPRELSPCLSAANRSQTNPTPPQSRHEGEKLYLQTQQLGFQVKFMPDFVVVAPSTVEEPLAVIWYPGSAGK